MRQKNSALAPSPGYRPRALNLSGLAKKTDYVQTPKVCQKLYTG